MSSLTAIFGNTHEDGDESEKLKELFQNRAELKKEFASLREETYRLQQLLKEKDGSVARIEQRLEHLENLLYDPEWVHNVAVFYQLRALNKRCEGQLARFAEQLKQQREQKLQRTVIDAWQGEKNNDAAVVRKRLGEHRVHMQLLEDQLQAQRHKFATTNGITKMFRKRSLENQLEDIEQQLATVQAQEAEMLDDLATIEKRNAPDTQGLDVASKRSINFMILSFAQQIYVHFTEHDLAGMAKEAGEKSVGAVRYGSKSDCDSILEIVKTRGKSMEGLTDLVDVLQHRARLISEKALFKNDDDAVPVPGTVATVYMIDSNGRVRDKDANLLGGNYWNISAVLSR